MANFNPNRIACFLAYCRGVPVEEICHVHLITPQRLREWITKENWDEMAKHQRNLALSDKAAETLAPTLVDAQQRTAELLENRAKNYKQAQRLRDLVESAMDEIQSQLGLGIKKAAPSNEEEAMDEGFLTAKGIKMAVDAIKGVTQAAATAQDLTYRALGDKDSAKETSDKPSGNTINVIIPRAISEPRRVDRRNAKEIVLEAETTG